MAREAQAVLAGHVDVYEGQVDLLLRDQRLRGSCILGADRRVTVCGEIFLEDLADIGLVVDDQYRAFRNHGD